MPVPVVLQIAIIYSVVNNLLSDVPTEDIGRFEEELFEYLVATKKDLLDTIAASGNLTEETTAALREAILACKAKFLE